MCYVLATQCHKNSPMSVFFSLDSVSPNFFLQSLHNQCTVSVHPSPGALYDWCISPQFYITHVQFHLHPSLGSSAIRCTSLYLSSKFRFFLFDLFICNVHNVCEFCKTVLQNPVLQNSAANSLQILKTVWSKFAKKTIT